MKIALLYLISTLLTINSFGQDKGLSKKAQEEFKIGAYIAYKECQVYPLYCVLMCRALNDIGYNNADVDELFETLNKPSSFNAVIYATRKVVGISRVDLYYHLLNGLEVSKKSADELFIYIQNINGIPGKNQHRIEKEVKEVPMVVKCNNKLTQLEMELSNTYKKLYHSLNSENRSILNKSQLEWIKVKDKKCLTEQQDFNGGTKAGLVFCDCSVLETQERIEALKNGTYR